MASLPYNSSIGWAINQSHVENIVEFKTGSYTIEATYGINPIDSKYSIYWNLPSSSASTLLSTYRTNPTEVYDWTDPNGTAIKVKISDLSIDPIRIDGSVVRVNATLKRRYL